MILNLLNDKKNYKSEYTDEEGNKSTFFEIVNNFGKVKDFNQTGLAIDVHMGWISDENKYITEYLVTKEYLTKVLKEKCNMRLIDTALFHDLYEINKPFFMDTINHEEHEKNRNFYMKVKKFYDQETPVDKESKIYSDLFRYYIFQKM